MVTTLHPPEIGTESYRGNITAIALMGLWFAVMSVMGVLGHFEYARNEAHEWIIVAVLAPTVFYLALYATMKSVRDWTAKLDPAIVVLPHAWRTVGFAFLALWYFDVLPGEFAAPAGFGDFAVGMAAPIVAVALWLGWKGAVKSAVTLHILGIVDFFFAILTGAGSFGVPASDMHLVDPMTVYPMVWIPTGIVPLLLVGHVIGLINLRTSNRAS